MCTDMVGCERSAAPSVGAGLSWERGMIKNKSIDNKNSENDTNELSHIAGQFTDEKSFSRRYKELGTVASSSLPFFHMF